MGLLEKAGKMQTDEPKAAKKKAGKKTAEPKATPKPRRERRQRKQRAPRQKRERKARVPRTMPDQYQNAGEAAKFARRLVDIIVNMSGISGLVGITATGAYFDPTIFIVLAIIPPLINILILPYFTSRTIGMFLTRTRWVTWKDKTPPFIHQSLKSFTSFLVLSSLGLFMMGLAEVTGSGAQSNSKVGFTNIAIAVALILFPLIDFTLYRFNKKREPPNYQTMWDMIFGAWLVVGKKDESEGGGRWMERLESLGDWGEKRGWAGGGAEDGDSEESKDES